MNYYGGIDLHSDNVYIVIINEDDKIIYEKRLSNNLGGILEALSTYQNRLAGLVVESTYNWYWLVDGLQATGYEVHLANTCAVKVYEGMKHTDDKTDAFWLAHLLRLKLLPTGYIYPESERGLRELLRQRLHLVREQTSTLLTIQGVVTRYENIKLTGTKIKSYDEEKLLSYIKDDDVKIAVKTRYQVLQTVMKQILVLEEAILKSVKKDKAFKLLQTVPGVGPILAMTILLEAGPMERFKDVGNFSSYCRCVSSEKISNGKKKGENNSKNGNPYLAWAFMEAGHHAIRAYPPVKKFHQRQLAKKHKIVAYKSVANKLARACFFVLRDKVEFDMKKLFG
jgi:transposase